MAISKYCSTTREPHSFKITFCDTCGSGPSEIIDIDSPSPRTKLGVSRVAATERDIVNSRLKVTTTRLNARSNALSFRILNLSRTISQFFNF
jgi:hypothetical protein